MACGCSDCCTDCCTDCTCENVCTAMEIENAWNVPSCLSYAVLSIPGLSVALIGSYIYNPTYGWFKVTAFDSVNSQVTVLNECPIGNAAVGTAVPAGTTFIFGGPPSGTNTTFYGEGSGTNYVVTTVTSPVVFGTNQSSITITSAGTYLISAFATFGGNILTTLGGNIIRASLNRQNNTPALLTLSRDVWFLPVIAAPFTGIFAHFPFPSIIYTTANSNDIININAHYTGVLAAGSIEVSAGASITAVKLY